MGDGIALIALVLYVKNSERSGIAVGAVLVAQAVPHLAGPLMGAIADRLDVKRVMVGCELAQAAVFSVIALWQPPFVPLLALVGLGSLLDTTFGPAVACATPVIVETRDLMQANAWLGTSLNLQVALGPILGGLLVSGFGVRWALAANALSFAISGILLVGLPGRLRVRAAQAAGIFDATLEGLRFVWRSPPLRALVMGVFFIVAFAAVDNVALVFLTRDVLHTSVLGYGLVAGAFGVGMLLASIALSTTSSRPKSVPMVLTSWLLASVGNAATGLAPNGVAAGAAQAIGGVGNGIGNIGGPTLIQEIVPGPMLGRVFALYGTSAMAASSVAYVLAGILLDLTSARVTFIVGAAGAILTLLLAGPPLRRASASEPSAAKA